ncbi:MAG: HIT family protein [bacterium]
MENCIFCKIIAGEIPAEKIYDNGKVMAFLDINPVNPGHTLVIPKAHHENLVDTEDSLLCEIILAVKKLAPIVMKAVGAEGYNLGVNSGVAAGQVIFHTHFHITPRFSSDGFKHWRGQPYKEGEIAEVGEKIRKIL